MNGITLHESPADVGDDHLVVLQIDGMHCHKCEERLVKALSSRAGVREVEVDFRSGQASVLVNRREADARALMRLVEDAGYTPTGFIERDLGGESVADESGTLDRHAPGT